MLELEDVVVLVADVAEGIGALVERVLLLEAEVLEAEVLVDDEDDEAAPGKHWK